MALVLAFLSAENENRQLQDLPLADFGRLTERLLLPVWTKSINENFVNWKLLSLLFLLSRFNAFFHLQGERQRTLWLLFGDCRVIYFHALMKSAFLLSKGLLCLYDQNNTCRYGISLIELNTRREIPYLGTPTYYSLCVMSNQISTSIFTNNILLRTTN